MYSNDRVIANSDVKQIFGYYINCIELGYKN